MSCEPTLSDEIDSTAQLLVYHTVRKEGYFYDDTCLHIYYMLLYASLISYEKQSYIIACLPYLHILYPLTK